MDRAPHDYAAAMAFASQQHPQANLQHHHHHHHQQQFGFHPQHQPFPQFLPPQQQFPYHRPPQLHPHAPPPHLLHLHQQQQQHPSPISTPGFPPHIPPHLTSPSPFHGPYDSPPLPAPPPSDPELLKRIDKLIEYAVKNGPEFEAMIREKQQDNPAYGFLFGGEGHYYYRYKLWMVSRQPGGPFNVPFQSSHMQMMHPPNPMMSSSPLTAPQYNGSPAASASVLGPPHLHQPPFPPSYDQQPPLSFARPDYDNYRSSNSRPLPPEIDMELNNVLNNLTGTKESIKGAKNWFMQRSPFIHALAEALRERVFSMDDSERQLHIVYLANDILFDSLQRRLNPHELDNEALAFKPVLASMLARVFHNPQNKEENQSRLQKIVQFWGSKEVFDQETILAFENEMVGGPPSNSFTGPQRDSSTLASDPSAATGGTEQNALEWKADGQSPLPILPDQDNHIPHIPSVVIQHFHPTSVPVPFSGSIPLPSSLPPSVLPPTLPANLGEKLPTYPLFPPGLIPGMVRKMQIGSGVPYSPLSPLDIPTVIPPSTVSQSEILERVSKFFREIDEVNPSEGPMKPSSGSPDGYDDYEREPPTRKGGACIPPPPNLQDFGAVSLEPEPNRSGRHEANSNEASQYDDVYSSYRKERSTNYHSSMSAKAPSTTR
ncbi:unnamed protein product [Cuscuta campestris]|uniref:SURP motif domain-containing protein n=1 Tax=Cuscuta campestris TaxID=132261 RepID=A0A484KK23_9ASTE|nr:unnamed protein product [Cuscuta campestris]